MNQSTKNPPLRKDQKRGLERRRLILKTTRALLVDTDPEQLSLAEVAQHSDIPTSSLYHFYRDVSHIYADIAGQFHQELMTHLMEGFASQRFASWQSLIAWLIHETAGFYNSQPAFSVLLLSGKAPASIKQTDRELDNELSQALSALFESLFKLPRLTNLSQIVYNAVEIVDLFFSLALRRENTLGAEGIEEARRAAIAYLRCYLPEYLELNPDH